jgi:hypothetical protein
MLNKSLYNPNEKDLDKMVGMFEAKEPFNSVVVFKKMECGEDI